MLQNACNKKDRFRTHHNFFSDVVVSVNMPQKMSKEKTAKSDHVFIIMFALSGK